MGIISQGIEKRASSLTLKKVLFGGGGTRSGVSVSPDSAMRTSAVWACIRVLSTGLAAMPLHVYRDRPDGGHNKAIDSPLYNLLHRTPNPEQTSYIFRQTAQAHICLYGNAYAEIEFDNFGNPVALWPIPPWCCQPLRTPSKELYYQVVVNGQSKNLQPYRILHVMGLGTDGMRGLSPIRQHAETIGISIAAEQFGGSFFGNGMNVGGILEHPGKLTAQGSDNLRKSVNEKYAGLSNANRLILLEEGMKYQKVGIPPNEAQFLETRQFQIEDIARIYGVQLHKIGHLLHATFCLPADVEVFTESGSKSIVDIIVGEKVWSLNPDGLWALSVVNKSSCTGTDEILEIKTTNRTIRANSKHRIYMRRKYSSPQPGVGGYQNVEWHNEWVPAGDLKIGDTLISLSKLPDANNNIIPTRTASIGFMEFCGLYIGDGNKTKNSINIARAMTANYMDYYRDVIKSEFQNNKGSIHLEEQPRSTRFSSVKASAELSVLGFNGTAHNKQVPGWVFSLSDELKLAFLRGFLDADGSVDKNGRVSYSSCNEKMLSTIRHLCISLGISVTNLRCQEGFTTLPNGRRCALKQYVFTCSNPEDNSRIGSHDSRYIERLNNGKPFNRKNRKYPRWGGKNFNITGCALSRIISIEHQSPELVYDLEVEGTHSFIANGVVVHNSNIEHQAIEFVTDTMLPWVVNWEQEYDRRLCFNGLYTKHSLEGLLRGDSASRAAFYKELFYISAITPDQIREKEDMNPEPNGIGDRYYIQGNMVPADKIDEFIKKPTSQGASRGLLTDVVRRIAEREKQNIMRATKKPDTFDVWLSDFYRDFPEYIERQLEPVMGDGAAEYTREYIEDSKRSLEGFNIEFAESLLVDWESNKVSKLKEG